MMSEIYDEGLLPPNVHRPMEKKAGAPHEEAADARDEDGRESRPDPEEKEDAARREDPGRVDGRKGAEGTGIESSNEDTPADTSEPPD